MRVSILINNYNYGAYLEECIDSLLNQTYQPIEVILYDDGSTDNSLRVAKQYNNRIKVLAFPNHGKKPAFNQANAINCAFSISTGEIICLLDSDDFFAIDKVENIVDAFDANPNAVLVQNSAHLYRDGKVVGSHDYAYTGLDYKKKFYESRWTAFFNPTSCLSFRRSYLENVLPLEEDEFWRVWPDVRLSRISPFYGKIVSLKSHLTFYRRHGNNDSKIMNKDSWNTYKNQRDHHIYINQFLEKKGEPSINFKYSLGYFKYFTKGFFSKVF